MSTYLLVVPVRSIFKNASDSYSLVLRKLKFDHTDLIELCLRYWLELDDRKEEPDFIFSLAESYTVRFHRTRRPLSFTEAQSVAYALRSTMESGYDFLKPWVDLAQSHFGYLQLDEIRARTYLSPTSILLELTTT